MSDYLGFELNNNARVLRCILNNLGLLPDDNKIIYRTVSPEISLGVCMYILVDAGCDWRFIDMYSHVIIFFILFLC